LVGRDKRDGKTLGTETTSTTDTMKIRVGISRQVVVDSQVDTFDINTTTKDIGGNADTLVELLEFFVPADTKNITG
jgi:hypothetical protein